MKKWIIIGALGLIGITALSILISGEVSNAFENINQRLEDRVELTHTSLTKDYEEFILKVEAESMSSDSVNQVIKDSIQGLYRKYVETMLILEENRQFIIDSIINIDPKTGEFIHRTESTENQAYWMGSSPQSNNGRGNGKAILLKEQLDSFIFNISTINRTIGVKIEVENLYLPQKLESKIPGKSWEEYTFEGPAIANLASLSGLKLDIQDFFLKELEFLKGIIAKEN